MQEMKIQTEQSSSGTQSNFFNAAEKVLSEISSTFNSKTKLSPQQTIASAKELSTKSNQLYQQLTEMAKNTKDPVLKEKLQNSAKLIKDGSIQIKILSAVSAAGGEGGTSSVSMAVKGLQTNIQEILSAVRAEELKNKFRSTVMQTVAINRVINVWKKKAHIQTKS